MKLSRKSFFTTVKQIKAIKNAVNVIPTDDYPSRKGFLESEDIVYQLFTLDEDEERNRKLDFLGDCKCLLKNAKKRTIKVEGYLLSDVKGLSSIDYHAGEKGLDFEEFKQKCFKDSKMFIPKDFIKLYNEIFACNNVTVRKHLWNGNIYFVNQDFSHRIGTLCVMDPKYKVIQEVTQVSFDMDVLKDFFSYYLVFIVQTEKDYESPFPLSLFKNEANEGTVCVTCDGDDFYHFIFVRNTSKAEAIYNAMTEKRILCLNSLLEVKNNRQEILAVEEKPY